VARHEEFALLGEILGSVEWGARDLLMFELLPPETSGTVQYAISRAAKSFFS